MKCIPSLVVITFSNTFDSEVNIETGQEFALSVSILRLKTGVRHACFHSDGNERFRIQKLVNLVTFSAITGDPERKIHSEMPSTPTAFLGLRWSKILRIYEVLTGE